MTHDLHPDSIVEALGLAVDRLEGAPGIDASLLVAGCFRARGRHWLLPRVRLVGPRAGDDAIRVGIFAAIHGDEPAGTLACLGLVERAAVDPSWLDGMVLELFPVCNPTGLADRSRCNHEGLDLNRLFWQRHGLSPEIPALEAVLRETRFDGVVSLHADDTCEGLYGYALGSLLNEQLLRPALEVASAHLRRDRGLVIDGFPATDGVIRADCYPGILSPPPDSHPRPFEIIFETPALAPLEAQAVAAEEAIVCILDGYKSYISQGMGL